MKANKIAAFAVGPIGSAALGFVTLPIITWFYSVEDIGRISTLQVASSLCVLLFCLGLDQAYVRDYHEEPDRPSLLKNTLLPSLLLTILSSLALLTYDRKIISSILYAESSTYLSLLTLGCIVAALISRFLSLVLRMQEKALAFSMSQILPKLLFLIIIIICASLATQATFYTLITIHVISILAVLLVFSWNTRDDWIASASCTFDKAKLHRMLQFGLPLVIGGLAYWGLNTMDKLYLRVMSNFTELGIYSVTTSIAAGAGIFASIFTTIWAPTVFKWAAKGINSEKIDSISEYILAAVFFIFSLTGVFSWLLPYFLPKVYAPAQQLISACVAAPLLYALSETTAIGISIKRKTSYSMLASIIAATVNFAGNYCLVPAYGAAGAAASTAFAFWIFLICRTELSSIAWRQIPRKKLYLTTLTCTLTSIVFALTPQTSKSIVILTWLTIGVSGVLIFKKTLTSMKKSTLGLAHRKTS